MKDQYEDEPWMDPRRDANWMWRGEDLRSGPSTLYSPWGYNDPRTRQLDSNPFDFQYDPKTQSYRRGYNDPKTGIWHWGPRPGERFGGGGGPVSGGAGGAAGGGPSAAGGPMSYASLAASAGKAGLNYLAQRDANKQIQAQAGMTEAERQRLLAANSDFLGRFGSRLSGPQTTSRSSRSGGRSVTDQTKVVDPAQAALKAQLEAALGRSAALPEDQMVSRATRAATDEEIAARERAMRETLGAAVAQRGGAPSSQGLLVNMPAANRASTERLNATSRFDEMGFQRSRQAKLDLQQLLNDWQGQRNETNFSNWDESTSTDPNGGLDALYRALMFSPGAEQKALLNNPLYGLGEDFLSGLEEYLNRRA